MSARLADHIPGFLAWMELAHPPSASAVKGYGANIRMFVAFCEQLGIVYTGDVTFRHVEAFGAVLRGHPGQKETSMARGYSALRRFFLYLERHDLLQQNPAKHPNEHPHTAWLRRQLDTLGAR